MADKNANPSGRVTPFAEIQKLTLPQTVERFIANCGAAVRLFAVTAKLMLHLAVSVKAPQTVGGLLRKSGISKSTIDNARQHARVFEELVLQKHITEAQFDKLSFAECVVINRAMSGAAKAKQTGKKIAALIKSKPDTFDVELDCLARYGHSRAKQDKVEKDAEKKRAAEERAAAKIAAKDGGKTTTTPDTKTPAAPATPAPGVVVASGITKHTASEAIKALEAAEAIFNELTPVQAAEALPKLSELHAHVTAYVGTIKPPTRKPSAAARRKIVKMPVKAKAKKIAAKKNGAKKVAA